MKGWNAEEMDNYAALVQLGEPDFIEIKGVTFCGSSKGRAISDGLGKFVSFKIRFFSYFNYSKSFDVNVTFCHVLV